MHLIAACYTSSRPCPRSIRASRHMSSCLCSHKIYRQRGQYKSTFAIWSSQLAASNKYGVLTPKRASLDASRLRVKWTRTTYMMHACNYGCFAGSGLRLARGASKGALQTRAFARFTQPILAAWTKRTVVEDHWFKEAKVRVFTDFIGLPHPAYGGHAAQLPGLTPQLAVQVHACPCSRACKRRAYGHVA